MGSAPRSNDDHKIVRLEWPKKQLDLAPSNWVFSIFSYDKRFSSDVQDGCAYHSTYNGIDPRHSSIGQKRDGSAILRDTLSAAVISDLATVEGMLDSDGHFNIREDCFNIRIDSFFMMEKHRFLHPIILNCSFSSDILRF